MDFFTHLLIGALLSVFVVKPFGSEFILLAMFMAILPDLDVFLEFSKKIRSSLMLSHKGMSHSIFTGLALSAIVGFFLSTLWSESLFLVWITGFLFYSLHLFLDYLGASKIPLFYPLTKKRFRFIVERAINPLMMLVSISITIVYCILFFVAPRIFYSETLSVLIFMLFIIYFLYRVLSKIVIQARLPEHQRYIPGILPFTYTIYEIKKSKFSFDYRLIKKRQFRSKEIDLVNSSIVKGSLEMELLEKALLMRFRYTFFLKWEALIPIIKQDDKHITVILFLGESFARETAYYLKMLVLNDSLEIIEISDGFDKVFKL
ncbi:MAG: hypothetical protein GF353_15545 [Candidatus Lokiarchaeota archaeon]|nr:hypothetical protein [Candidatus Lokiarchaeota archaeon]